jgi:hypothetical protein
LLPEYCVRGKVVRFNNIYVKLQNNAAKKKWQSVLALLDVPMPQTILRGQNFTDFRLYRINRNKKINGSRR